jgi:signal transduction histidine kinase
VWTANGDLCAEVTDDGRGFDPARLAPGVHHGITGMGERAELLGGQLEIDSQSGVATTARCTAGQSSAAPTPCSTR